MGRGPSTIIINDTGYEIGFQKYEGGIFRRPRIAAGERYGWDVDLAATYREFIFQAVGSPLTVGITSDDAQEWSEIRLLEGPDGAFEWVGTIPRTWDQDHDDFLHKSAKDVSLKFDEALRSCAKLEMLCKKVKICRHQCNHLVQTYKEGIQEMAEFYADLIGDGVQIMRLIRGERLTKLENALDRLEYIICDAKDLLGSCATDLGKVGLVVSSLRPPVEEDVEVYSDFDLIVRELQWHLDVIEYLIDLSGHAILEWSPTMGRCVLKRSNGNKNIVAQEKVADQKKPHSRACMDHEELQSGLKDGSIYIPNSIVGWCTRKFFGLGQKNLSVTVLKRCKAHEDLQSRPVALGKFEINHLDIHPCIPKRLGEGAFKTIYEGKWYAESVAIATIRMDDPETSQLLSSKFKDEVHRLIQLQHPKVVSFFGWAETTDAPEPIKEPGEKHSVQGGYIVMEKMDCDLNKLIMVQKRERKNSQEGPFSPSVQIDILQQIVEAVLHLHNQGFFHRDLKPGNFLVKARSSPRRDADTYFNVKLVDFGSSKLYEGEDDNTYNVGTTLYGDPKMMKGSMVVSGSRGKYDKSVDVFSFAMTCYQVITGRKPFQGRNPVEALKNKERPEFPQTVLYGLKELTEACWLDVSENRPSEKRPSFEEIQERLWAIKMKLAVE